MMKIAITGHTNIEKTKNVFNTDSEKYNQAVLMAIMDEIETFLFNYIKDKDINNDITLISGMARGIDEIFALIAIKNNFNLILCIPNSIKWHKNRSYSRGSRVQAIFYDKILRYKNITEIHEIKKDYKNNSFWCANMARNQAMVDLSDIVFSYKSYDSTGTDDCIKRAKESKKYFGNIPKIESFLDDF